MSNQRPGWPGRGLVIAAGFGLTLMVVAVADEPDPRGRGPAPSPGAAAERYLLLTDGRLIRGVVSHDGSAYTVVQKIGPIRYPKAKVERDFDTVQEAFRYRLERAPEDDPSERLRLARWCMTHHLDKEARMLLEQVVEISPDHGPARAMLTRIAQAEAARSMRGGDSKVDEGVRQTAGDVAEDRPGALDSDVLRGAGRRMGITGLPVIFDLPPAMAINRAQEFKQYIDPVLQAYCAKCHNDGYDGTFHLVPWKTARQRTPDVLRANLDATLALIDPENPARSELLSSTLRPHGNVGKRRPIFTGSNDRAYQILAKWVTSLRPQAGAGPSGLGAGRDVGEPGESFAASRNRDGTGRLEELPRGMRRDEPAPVRAMPTPAGRAPGGRAYRYVEGQGMVPEDLNQADPREFPLSYMLGGPRPTVPGGPAAKDDAPRRPPASAHDPAAGGAGPARPDADRTPAAEPSKVAPTKPVKIDPRVLEQFLKRNANRAGGQ